MWRLSSRPDSISTGAGKSILIDALALLLGDKASSDVIRSGADRAIVASVFELDSRARKVVREILETNGIDPEDETIILRREIASVGKGRVFVNNQPATVGVLRQLAPHLATHRGSVREMEGNQQPHSGVGTRRERSLASARSLELPEKRNR